MERVEKIVQNMQRLGRGLAGRIGFLGPLLARVAVGSVFVGTGWGKLHSLDSVTSYFTELGIPAPHLNAIMAASTEFVCGCLLIAGLATRLAAIPLTVVMTVAILTAKRGDIAGFADLLALEEFTYITVFVWLALAGPGMASLDALVARWWRNRSHTTPSAGLSATAPLRA